MIVQKRTIKKSHFFLISTFSILNTLMLLRVIFTFSFHRIITHETIWSFILSSIYLICIFITDTNMHLFNSAKLEPFNFFIRNTYSIIAYSYCYSITIEFWLILFFGLSFGKNPFSEKKVVPISLILETLYLHLGITIIMIIDLILTKRRINKNNKNILLIINIIYILYSIVVLFANYVFLKPAYPFMKNSGIGLILVIFIISFILINACYFLHLFLVQKINNEKLKKFS